MPIMGASMATIITALIMIFALTALTIAIYICIVRYMERETRKENKEIMFFPKEPTTTNVEYGNLTLNSEV